MKAVLVFLDPVVKGYCQVGEVQHAGRRCTGLCWCAHCGSIHGVLFLARGMRGLHSETFAEPKEAGKMGWAIRLTRPSRQGCQYFSRCQWR